MVPDVLYFRGHFGNLKNPLASEASSYADSHAITRGSYRLAAPEVNRVQVFGDSLLVEGFDWDSITDVYDRVTQVDDLNLDTVAKGQERSSAILRKEEIRTVSGEITVTVNCGQELYDVIEITDSAAGLSAAKGRVMGISLRFSPKSGSYEQRLLLGAP